MARAAQVSAARRRAGGPRAPCFPGSGSAAPAAQARARPAPIVRSGGGASGPAETPGAAAAASSCRRLRRPLHRLPG